MHGDIISLEPNRNVHSRKRGSVRTCIKTGFQAWLLDEFTEADRVAILLIGDGGGDDNVLASLYLDILAPVAKTHKMVLGTRKPLVKGIDTNAHSKIWGSRNCDHRGEALKEIVTSYDFKVQNSHRHYADKPMIRLMANAKFTYCQWLSMF